MNDWKTIKLFSNFKEIRKDYPKVISIMNLTKIEEPDYEQFVITGAEG
jgi:hypothetical protein